MQKITRTITESEVTVNAYSTETKLLMPVVVDVPGDFNKLRFKEKAIRTRLPEELKLVEVLSVHLIETKYSMPLEVFMEQAKKEDTIEVSDSEQEEEV